MRLESSCVAFITQQSAGDQWCHFAEERESLAGVLICLGFMEENQRIALRWSSRTKGICIGLGNPKNHLALDH